MTKKDANQVVAMLGLANNDGTTATHIKADPSSHAIGVDDGVTGSDLGASIAKRDTNGNPIMIAASNADGETPVTLYADPANGKLLIKST